MSGFQGSRTRRDLAVAGWTDTRAEREIGFKPARVMMVDSSGVPLLGEQVSVLVPEVVGCRLSGAPGPGVTATDIVLTLTQMLRREKLIGAFVEYWREGSTRPAPSVRPRALAED